MEARKRRHLGWGAGREAARPHPSVSPGGRTPLTSAHSLARRVGLRPQFLIGYTFSRAAAAGTTTRATCSSVGPAHWPPSHVPPTPRPASDPPLSLPIGYLPQGPALQPPAGSTADADWLEADGQGLEAG